jgi:ubiquinone/menaquinone biosynthesis C-methylase UbiE
VAFTDLGETTDLDVIVRMITPSGLALIDIGCGTGELARGLVGLGCTVMGVEPDPIQAAANRSAEPLAGLSFAEAAAGVLPASDGAYDGAIFSKALHHVPIAAMPAAIDEAARVINPNHGFLLVLEPSITGAFSQLMQPFHDETVVRLAAQAALDRHAAPRFAERTTVVYRTTYRYADFTSFVEETVGATFNPYRRDQVDTPEVRMMFEQHRTVQGYAIEQSMRADLFRRPKPHV